MLAVTLRNREASTDLWKTRICVLQLKFRWGKRRSCLVLLGNSVESNTVGVCRHSGEVLRGLEICRYTVKPCYNERQFPVGKHTRQCKYLPPQRATFGTRFCLNEITSKQVIFFLCISKYGYLVWFYQKRMPKSICTLSSVVGTPQRCDPMPATVLLMA